MRSASSAVEKDCVSTVEESIAVGSAAWVAAFACTGGTRADAWTVEAAACASIVIERIDAVSAKAAASANTTCEEHDVWYVAGRNYAATREFVTLA